MLRKISPIVRLTVGITALTLSIALAAEFFGLFPDVMKEKLQARSRVAEALTIQLSNAAAMDDKEAIEQTIATVVQRDPSVLSIAVRRNNGSFLAATENHSVVWRETKNGVSTPSNVQVPLFNGDEYWGRVEMVFSELDPSYSAIGFSANTLKLFAFFGFLGLALYYVLLKRSLRQLDPSKVVPARVQAAFDTLDEGVVIVDEKEQILLINHSMSDLLGKTPAKIIGEHLSGFQWRHWEKNAANVGFPWRTAIAGRKTSVMIPMGIRMPDSRIKSFNVNASCIIDEDGKTSGAIVTFSDVTILEKQNADLELTVKKLIVAEEDLVQQNLELQYLANHDPMTGCLNRRNLFSQFKQLMGKAVAGNTNLACLMVDIDYFKGINDRYGHAVGDDVIIGVAKTLSSNCRSQDLIGRYGGEEFCIVLDGLDYEQAEAFGEKLRINVLEKSHAWLQQGNTVSVSIGVSALENGVESPDELVNQADMALYKAKESGRNRVVGWHEMQDLPDAQARKAAASNKARNKDRVRTTEPPTTLTKSPYHIGALERIEQNHAPNIDVLTGLPTLTIFEDRLGHAILRAERQQQNVAVLSVSVDTADQVAEAFGTRKAEQIVKKASEVLSNLLRRTDTISLLGGRDRIISFSRSDTSRFLVEISQLDDVASVTWIVKRILDHFSQPCEVEGIEHLLKCTIGVGIYPEDGADCHTLIHHANLAQARALKENGINSFRFFSKDMGESVKELLRLEAGTRDALEANDFSLHYQPIIRLDTGQVAAAEALLRCSNEQLKDVPIQMLISVAEQTGLMNKLGEWIVRTATSQMQNWANNGVNLPMLSINISAKQIGNPKVANQLADLVLESGCNPSSIQFEVTETAYMKDLETAGNTLKGLQKIGVQVALDDFGTGQSSLSYVQKLSPDAIKIDRSFIDGIDVSHANEAMVAAVTEMSNRLGLRVVAEGVESEEQMAVLQNLGCTEIQGYLISPPMPSDVFVDWLRLFQGEKNDFQIQSKNRNDRILFSKS